MLIAQYETRLPADHDMVGLRSWLAERGSVWDGTPDLHFKAILVRESGDLGAVANSWSSLYLWQREQAFADWLIRGGYEVVTDRYGRADIDTFTTLGAFRGPEAGASPDVLLREDVPIPVDADLTATIEEGIAEATRRATEPDVVLAALGIDPQRWMLRRITIAAEGYAGAPGARAYRIAYLSRTLMDTLPCPSAEEPAIIGS